MIRHKIPTKIKRLVLIMLAVLCLAVPSAAWATDIRVCLQTGAAEVEFEIVQGDYTLSGGKLVAETLAEPTEGDVVRLVKGSSGFTAYLNGQKIGTSAANISLVAEDSEEGIVEFRGKKYRDSFSVYTNGYVVNVLDLEYYLYGVVGEEIGYKAPTEALRTQAIVARSYAYFNMGGTYYDVSASTASQVYGGYTAESEIGADVIIRAVDDTAGQILYYDGKPVEAVFCSSAGGHTENNENVWGGKALPYLRGVKSPYDEDYSFYEWTVSYTPKQMKDLAEAYMERTGIDDSFGKFVRLELSYEAEDGGKTASGRVTEAKIIGTGCTVSAEKDAVRTLLGLKSSLFTQENEVEISENIGTVYVLNAAGNLVERPLDELYAVGAGGVVQQLGELATAYMRSAVEIKAFKGGIAAGVQGEGVTLTGHGYGHGVGLSQYGAIGMAEDGCTAEEILTHYYGGDDERLLELDFID